MIFTLIQLLVVSFIWGLIAAWLVYRAGYQIEDNPEQKALQQLLLGFFLPPVSLVVVIVLLRRYRKVEASKTL